MNGKNRLFYLIVVLCIVLLLPSCNLSFDNANAYGRWDFETDSLGTSASGDYALYLYDDLSFKIYSVTDGSVSQSHSMEGSFNQRVLKNGETTWALYSNAEKGLFTSVDELIAASTFYLEDPISQSNTRPIIKATKQ